MRETTEQIMLRLMRENPRLWAALEKLRQAVVAGQKRKPDMRTVSQ